MIEKKDSPGAGPGHPCLSAEEEAPSQQRSAQRPGSLMMSHARILLFEDTLLVVLPAFLIFSLRKFIHPAFFYALAGILVILVGAGIWRRKNILALTANYLFISSWAAFILGLWSIYDLGSLCLYPDSRVYSFLSKLSLSSPTFWAFGSRPSHRNDCISPL